MDPASEGTSPEEGSGLTTGKPDLGDDEGSVTSSSSHSASADAVEDADDVSTFEAEVNVSTIQCRILCSLTFQRSLSTIMKLLYFLFRRRPTTLK